MATQQITGRRTDGNRQIENPENAAALILREKVGDESGRNSDKGRFPDADQRVPEQQFTVRVGNRRQ